MFSFWQKLDSAVALVNIFEKHLVTFAAHHYRIRHQYQAIRNARENLQEGHVLLHIDFSENYLEKYGAEVMASHFGAHSQIVIHQGIMYKKVTKRLWSLCHDIQIILYCLFINAFSGQGTSVICHALR